MVIISSNVSTIKGTTSPIAVTNDDVVHAIDSLKKVISGNAGNSYTIDGITYDDGSNISNAVKSIIRAAKVERRR